MKIKLLAAHTDGDKHYAINDEIAADARLVDKLSRLGVAYEVVEVDAKPKPVAEVKAADPSTNAEKPVTAVRVDKKQMGGGAFFKKGNK